MNPRLAIPFYLGLGAPATGGRYPDCQVRAARGYEPELIRTLLLSYRGESAAGELRRINHRCAQMVLPDGRRFFLKEFPWHHKCHDLERWVRLSRVDRAWRAAHLLPRLGINTPRALGTAVARDPRGKPIEYLATEWLEGVVPFPEAFRAAGDQHGARSALLREFADHLRLWHGKGIYLRDLVKNVLVRGKGETRTYWLTDLDGLHPIKGVTRKRALWQMHQIEQHLGKDARQEFERIWIGL